MIGKCDYIYIYNSLILPALDCSGASTLVGYPINSNIPFSEDFSLADYENMYYF